MPKDNAFHLETINDSDFAIRGFFFHPVGVKNACEGNAEKNSFPRNLRDGYGVRSGRVARAQL